MKELFYFNLQQFADANTNVTTDLGMSVEMKTYYDKYLIDMAEPKLVHDQFGQKKPIPKNGGKKIEFRKYTPYPKALTPLTEGITPDGRKMEVTNLEAEVEQYGDYTTMSDVLDLTAIDDNIVQATKLNGAQAGKTLDTVVRDKINAGTYVQYCPKVSGSTVTEVTSRGDLDKTAELTTDVVDTVVAQLRAVDAPTDQSGYYTAIIHPYAAYSLMRDPNWRKPHEYVDTEHLYRGELGEYGGVRFVQTSEAKIFKGENLFGSQEYLTASTKIDSPSKSVTVSEVLTGSGLVGRLVKIGSTVTKITAQSGPTLTLDTAVTCQSGEKIYPAEGGASNIAVFSTLIFGDDAYGTTEVEGGGLQVIVKPLGAGEDPLNQRASVGWKALKTAEILIQPYIIRIESCNKFSTTAKAN